MFGHPSQRLGQSGAGKDARASTLPGALKGRLRGNKEGESGPPPLPIPTEGMSASMKEDNPGEESDILSPRGRKRTTSKDPETKVSKREKKSPPEGPALEGALAAKVCAGISPLTSRK